MKDRRRSQAVENIREYSERLCRSRLARLHDPTGRRLFDEEDIEVFKKNYYRKKTGENEQ